MPFTPLRYSAGTLSFTGYTNRQEKPHSVRIVSLLASATEIVCALGAGEMLVGRSHECDNPEWVRRLPACSDPAFDVIVWRDRHPIASGMVVPSPDWPISMAHAGEAVTVTYRRAPLPPPGST